MKKGNLILLIIIIAGFLLIVFINNIREEKGLIKTEFSSSNILADNSSTGLKEAIENSLKDSEGTYGIAVKNLKSGEYFNLNENRIFDPGSLYKLWIMAAAFQQIEKGTLTEDEILSQDIQHLLFLVLQISLCYELDKEGCSK